MRGADSYTKSMMQAHAFSYPQLQPTIPPPSSLNQPTGDCSPPASSSTGASGSQAGFMSNNDYSLQYTNYFPTAYTNSYPPQNTPPTSSPPNAGYHHQQPLPAAVPSNLPWY